MSEEFSLNLGQSFIQKIAEKIITSLYVFPEHNTDDYKQLKKVK